MRLNIGSGKTRIEGFINVDIRAFEGVDQVADITVTPWPWPDNSVEEVECNHVIEHLTAPQRVAFINELYRVLKPDAMATITAPHWSSARAYGDLTHQWPPVCEFWYEYLRKEWREENAPHSNYNPEVDFDFTIGYSFSSNLNESNREAQIFAITWYKEAIQDIGAKLIKRIRS